MEVRINFSVEEINNQVKRILNYPLFKNSPVLSRFLEFIIHETFQNNESQIKEYTIAIKVLYRSRDFNPSADSIVRIHAGRLRRALSDYYLTEGIYDPIIIRIPKGSYVPEVMGSDAVETINFKLPVSQEQVHKPIVAVFPFRVMKQTEDMDELPGLLEGQLSEELLSFHDVSVIGYYSIDMQSKINENILEAGKSAGADYIITGSITCIGKHIRVLINFLVTATGEVLLCKSFDRTFLPGIFSDIEEEIIQNFIGFGDRCHGIISHEWQKHHRNTFDNFLP